MEPAARAHASYRYRLRGKLEERAMVQCEWCGLVGDNDEKCSWCGHVHRAPVVTARVEEVEQARTDLIWIAAAGLFILFLVGLGMRRSGSQVAEETGSITTRSALRQAPASSAAFRKPTSETPGGPQVVLKTQPVADVPPAETVEEEMPVDEDEPAALLEPSVRLDTAHLALTEDEDGALHAVGTVVITNDGDYPIQSFRLTLEAAGADYALDPLQDGGGIPPGGRLVVPVATGRALDPESRLQMPQVRIEATPVRGPVCSDTIPVVPG